MNIWSPVFHRVLAVAVAVVVGSILHASAAEAIIEEKYTFNLGPEPRLDLENVNGAVRIQGGSRKDVVVQATKRGKDVKDLQKVQVETKTSGSTLIIRTKVPRQGLKIWNNQRNALVDYVIEVPKSMTLESVSTDNGSIRVEGVEGTIKVRTINGSAKADGLKSSADLKTVNGQIQASFAKLGRESRCSLEAVNGSLEILLPSSSDVVLEADTINGRIQTDFGEVTQAKILPKKSLRITLGEGGARIKATTVNGGIKFQKKGWLN